MLLLALSQFFLIIQLCWIIFLSLLNIFFLIIQLNNDSHYIQLHSSAHTSS